MRPEARRWEAPATRSRRAAWLLVALVAGAIGCGGASAEKTAAVPSAGAAAQKVGRASSAHARRHVVLVTVDGMLPEVYLHPDAHGLKVPTLRKLASEGATSDGAEPVFPSVTYPDHTSMLTGVVPAKHGIVANRSFDPMENDLDGWRWYAEDIERDPLWRLTTRAGLSTAMVHWPVTVGANVAWLVPEVWRAKDENDKKLVRALSTPGVLEDVAKKHPDFWSRFNPPAVRDSALADIATTLIEEHAPVLECVHLVEVDGDQHRFGVWSHEAVLAIENADAQIARILKAIDDAGIATQTDVVVASDHGFMNADKMVVPGALLRDAGLVTLDASGAVVSWRAAAVVSSGQAYLYVNDAAPADVRSQVQQIFAAKAKDPTSGIGRVYSAEEIRALGGDPKAFLAIEAAPGWQFGGGVTGPYVAAVPRYRATHGYDPRRPEMKASLVMKGPDVPRGKIVGARLVDVAPTIAAWLGVQMHDVDGKPVRIDVEARR